MIAWLFVKYVGDGDLQCLQTIIPVYQHPNDWIIIFFSYSLAKSTD